MSERTMTMSEKTTMAEAREAVASAALWAEQLGIAQPAPLEARMAAVRLAAYRALLWEKVLGEEFREEFRETIWIAGWTAGLSTEESAAAIEQGRAEAVDALT